MSLASNAAKYDATLSGPARGVAGASEYPAGRHVSGLHGGNGRAYAGDRCEASEAGTVIANDRDPQSLEMARANTAEYWDRIEFQHGAFSELNHTGSGRHAGGSRGEQVSPDGSGTRIFFYVRWTAGYAPGSNQGHDGGRSGESQCRKTTSRLALPARRRKESAEDYWSTDPGRPVRSTRHLADIVERAVPRIGSHTSCDSHFHGTEDGGQPGNGRAGRAAGTRAANGSPRRTHRHHFISLAGRPQSEKQFSRIGSTGKAVLLTKKPVVPGDREMRENPPSRSAKLRAVEMVERGR